MRTRVAEVIYDALSWTCWATRHLGYCGLMSDRFEFGYDEERDDFRVTVPNPLYRLWLWVVANLEWEAA